MINLINVAHVKNWWEIRRRAYVVPREKRLFWSREGWHFCFSLMPRFLSNLFFFEKIRLGKYAQMWLQMALTSLFEYLLVECNFPGIKAKEGRDNFRLKIDSEKYTFLATMNRPNYELREMSRVKVMWMITTFSGKE